MAVAEWGHFVAAVGVLVLAAMAVLRLHRVDLNWLPAIAIVRAAIQLAAITVLLSGVNHWPWLVVAFIVLMLTTASWTGASRAAGIPGGRRHAVVALVTGGLIPPMLAVVMGLVPFTAQHVIAVSGIVIGNAMSIVTLTSRRILADLMAHRDQVEGWLALGATPPQSTAWLRRASVREALLPNVDQARNTGLVTLPGAFIGALFGGASPMEAAQFQIVVLAAILLGASITGTVFSWLVGRNTVLPVPKGSS